MNQATLPSNLSNSSSNDDSINSFSFFSSFNSSISTKFSLLNGETSSTTTTTNNNNMTAMSRIQRRRKAKVSASTDRLSVTLHTSESDLNKHRQRRPEFDRQKSVSRWMADTLSTKGGQIRRSLSSHEALLSLSKRGRHGAETEKDKPRRNASFRLFRHRADSRRSMCKPVRKPSSGPDGLIQDVLMALSGGDSTHRVLGSTAGSTTSVFRSDEIGAPDDLDIEMDSDSDTENDGEEEEFGGSTDFTSAELKAQPPLLTGCMRWDASSPSRDEILEMHDVSPTQGQHSSRRSSETMPVLPPVPPFTPTGNKKKTGLTLRSGDAELDLLKNSSLAPLAAAAIAIATDTMEDNDIEEDEEVDEDEDEEEGVLNDVMMTRRKKNDASDHTDGATASSVCTWNDSISTDGVSLLSASNASIPYWTNRSTSSGLGCALERLKEETKNSKDFSQKSCTDETYGSAYTFHHDANESPAPAAPKVPLPLLFKSASDHPRSLATLVEPPLTPLRDASVVPPAMPRRSLSNHKDVRNDDDLPFVSPVDPPPMASPGDRLKCLIKNNSERRRRSSMPNGAFGGESEDHNESVLRRASLDNASTHSNSMQRRRASLGNNNSSHHSNSMQRRRASLDDDSNNNNNNNNNSSHHSSASRMRQHRRASLDSAMSSPSSRSSSRKSIPYPPSLDGDDDEDYDFIAESRRIQMQGLLTPKMSRTTRMSPGIGGAQRKRIGGGCGREPSAR